jgi:hypothetical protein
MTVLKTYSPGRRWNGVKFANQRGKKKRLDGFVGWLSGSDLLEDLHINKGKPTRF